MRGGLPQAGAQQPDSLKGHASFSEKESVRIHHGSKKPSWTLYVKPELLAYLFADGQRYTACFVSRFKLSLSLWTRRDACSCCEQRYPYARRKAVYCWRCGSGQRARGEASRVWRTVRVRYFNTQSSTHTTLQNLNGSQCNKVNVYLFF
jgi:hypothetical protein